MRLARFGKLKGELCDTLTLPEEAMGAARLTLTAGKYCLIENHRGILEYSPERVSVASRRGRITVTGAGLSLAAICAASLAVRGRIQTVEWE